MLGSFADGMGGYALDGWTVTEQRKRPLLATSRNLTRSASASSSLRSAGLHAAGLRQRGHQSSGAIGTKACAKNYSEFLGRSASSTALPRGEPLPQTHEVQQSASKTLQLSAGEAVCLHGLTKAPDLNGAIGICEEWDATAGRWMVRLHTPNARTLAVKPTNLNSASLVTPEAELRTAPESADASRHAKSPARCRDRGSTEEERRQRRANLAAPRRRRLVEETLSVVRDDYDPTVGLEEAAAAAKLEARFRTEEVQREISASLSQPRVFTIEAVTPEKPPMALRTRSEQLEYCEELSRPRAPQSPTSAATCVPQVLRTAAEQQRRCAQLSHPRLAPWELTSADDEKLCELNTAWRELLAARANAPCPEAVTEAKEWLANRASYFQSHNDESTRESNTSAPSSPRQRGATEAFADQEMLRGLQEVVEELLWVILLQLRCCPKIASGAPDALEDRLCGVLLSTVGPALRPVARRVLGPGTGLVRRLRVEFPRLVLHLGFRESEDLEPIPVSWSAEEIAARVSEVRSARDRLLSTDLTKALMARIGQ